MRSTWTIGKRIGAGFALVLVVLAFVAGWSTLGFNSVSGNLGNAVDCNELRSEITQREVDHLKWAKEVSDLLTDDSVTKLTVQTDPKQCAFGKWYYSEARQQAEALVPEIRSALAAIEEPHRHLHESAVEIGKCYQPADLMLSTALKQRMVDHVNWAREVMTALLDAQTTEVDVQLDPRQCAFGKWYYSAEVQQQRKQDPAFDQILAAVEEDHSKLHTSAIEINKLLAAGDREAALAYFNEHTAKYADATCAKIDEVIAWNEARVQGLLQAEHVYARKTTPALAVVQKHLGEITELAKAAAEQRNTSIMAQAGQTRTAVMIVSGVGIVAAIALALLVARSIVKVLKRVVTGLSEGAQQVNEAAGQVATASQQLAEGASEQASSLEETSSALEEMAAMTRTNAENAREANDLALQARTAADTGDKTMSKLNDAMNGINDSSSQISKIIKVIEEIAFQTNLLALNAAVEAARAGEHGKGFAVVADEVRNLAQRAAQAARETTTLIEDSVNRAREGTTVAADVGKSLAAIVSDVARVTELVGGITRASEEQAQGVDQINTAVSQMDKVTQQNAAGAEESASAAEELTAQAQTVQGMVNELTALVGGRAGAPSTPRQTAETAHTHGPATPAPAHKFNAPAHAPALHGADDAQGF